MEEILDRLLLRKEDADPTLIEDLITIVTDRIRLKLLPHHLEEFPKQLYSIVVEAVVAMLNKAELNHEGIQSERVDAFSIAFVEDVLANYKEELYLFKRSLDEDADLGSGVQFL